MNSYPNIHFKHFLDSRPLKVSVKMFPLLRPISSIYGHHWIFHLPYELGFAFQFSISKLV